MAELALHHSSKVFQLTQSCPAAAQKNTAETQFWTALQALDAFDFSWRLWILPTGTGGGRTMTDRVFGVLLISSTQQYSSLWQFDVVFKTFTLSPESSTPRFLWHVQNDADWFHWLLSTAAELYGQHENKFPRTRDCAQVVDDVGHVIAL